MNSVWIRGRGVNQACVSTYDYFFELISRHSKNFYIGKESFNEVAAAVENLLDGIFRSSYKKFIIRNAAKGMQYHGIGFTYTRTVEAPGQIK